MVFDEDLASRTRAALGGVRGVTEIRMFGGPCFTVRGNMAVGVTGDDLMVRLAPDEGEAALARRGVRPKDFTGKPMKGFVFVGPGALKTERMLIGWVSRGVAFAEPSRRRSRRDRRHAPEGAFGERKQPLTCCGYCPR
jgi:hypothetical protein